MFEHGTVSRRATFPAPKSPTIPRPPTSQLFFIAGRKYGRIYGQLLSDESDSRLPIFSILLCVCVPILCMVVVPDVLCDFLVHASFVHAKKTRVRVRVVPAFSFAVVVLAVYLFVLALRWTSAAAE